MYIRFLLCTLPLFVLLACTPPPIPWHIARGATESGPPQEVDLGTTTERVYNCGVGGDTLYLSPYRSLAVGSALFWESGNEFEHEVNGGVNGGIDLGLEATAAIGASLGTELQAKYGENYEVSEEIGIGWQLPAQPGEWIEYTLQWSEVWVRGDILREAGNKRQQINYRLRRTIRSEIVDKKLLPCDDEAEIPAPLADSAATPVAPAPADNFQLVIQGMGFALADATNPSQRRSMALLAAQMDAKRKLAVWLAGEEIEAVTLVVNGQVTKDEIRQKVSAWLMGVQILSEAYDEASGQATVEISPALDGARP